MTDRFNKFITEHRLIQPGERILLAVSGGLDSVVMAHLFVGANYSFGIAHANFQLRGAASDADAGFVAMLASELGAPFYGRVLDARSHAAEHRLSIQVAARELRYEWLEEIRSREGYHHIATAHHLNDSIETVLYNFAKGTGLRGLTGIPVRNGAVVRPLLFSTRAELEAYAAEHQIAYRKDRSNTEDKYDRNKIRLHVTPVLREINPGLEQTVAGNLQNLAETWKLYQWAVGYWRDQLATKEADELRIDYGALRRHPAARSLLHEWLSPLGFDRQQLETLLAGEPPRTGAIFEAPHHLLLVDRDQLIVERRSPETGPATFKLPAGKSELELPDGHLQAEWRLGRPLSFPADPFTAYLDGHCLSFPLELRHWRAGDFFCPLGMGGDRQKLQDFFSNKKVDRLSKDRIWLVEEDGGAIAWVIGHRIDERFRIREDTDGYLVLQFQKT